jgi:uncharacterized membrane protein YdbT with pleckstrin-like domain
MVMDDSGVIMEVRPLVVPAQYFVIGPLFSGFISIFPGFGTFVISNMIAGGFDPVVGYGIFAYILSFCVVMFLVYLKMFKEPERTSYRIYSDKIEYYEGFLSRHQRTAIFDQVIDVMMAEGLLQQTKGVGTITMVTQQLMSSGQGQLSNRQVQIRNVPDPQKVYDLIRSRSIDNSKSD